MATRMTLSLLASLLALDGRVLAQPAPGTSQEPELAPALSAPVEPASPAPITIDAAPRLAPADRGPVLRPTFVVPITRGSTEPEVPPMSGLRILGETLLGAGLGFGGLALGAYAGLRVECGGGCHDEFGGVGGALLGAYIGGSLGIGIGVYVAGSVGDETGSPGGAIGGAFLGLLVGGAGAALIEKINNDGSASNLATLVALGGWVGGAIIGFNLGRRSTATAPAVGSLVMLDHGHASLGVPMVMGASGSGYLSLASGRF